MGFKYFRTLGHLLRLMKYLDFVKTLVPMNDDLFDFFYEAMPGYEEVGRRRILLGCWGSFQDPDVCDYQYRHMDEWGKAMFVTPGVVGWSARKSTVSTIASSGASGRLLSRASVHVMAPDA